MLTHKSIEYILQLQTNEQTFFSTFGEALSKYLKKNGIKQSYLVKNLGIDKTSMSHYVNGKHVPSDKNKKKLEDLLGILFCEHKPNQWKILDTNIPKNTTKEKDYNILTNNNFLSLEKQAQKRREMIKFFLEDMKDVEEALKAQKKDFDSGKITINQVLLELEDIKNYLIVQANKI